MTRACSSGIDGTEVFICVCWPSSWPMLSESSDAASELAQNIDMAIDGISITPLDGGQPMTSRRAFDATFSDGILAPHQGRIVHERYAS